MVGDRATAAVRTDGEAGTLVGSRVEASLAAEVALVGAAWGGRGGQGERAVLVAMGASVRGAGAAVREKGRLCNSPRTCSQSD